MFFDHPLLVVAVAGALALATAACGEAATSSTSTGSTSTGTTSSSSSSSPPQTQPGEAKSIQPLGMWMKANASPALGASDFHALATSFDRIGTFALPGTADSYSEWSMIATQGANAARANDLEGCRYACKSCHDKYRGAYRSALKTSALKTSAP